MSIDNLKKKRCTEIPLVVSLSQAPPACDRSRLLAAWKIGQSSDTTAVALFVVSLAILVAILAVISVATFAATFVATFVVRGLAFVVVVVPAEPDC